jgi:hypothetical protein
LKVIHFHKALVDEGVVAIIKTNHAHYEPFCKLTLDQVLALHISGVAQEIGRRISLKINKKAP